MRDLLKQFSAATSDENFLGFIKRIETLVSKLLSIAMVLVLLVSVVDLGIILSQKLFLEPDGFFNGTLIEIFGLFLNILIALEILENITAYLRKHVIQLELVVATSLTAVARKIIIFDFNKATGIDLIGLAIATFALAISYWIVRWTNRKEAKS
ncbi:MAG TPA: phosphate-starvation-inducible PsiE family protein [Crinalium sp.]|jgi:uncharacterized membrane protein (DUF373 family)